ncbi:MAG: hypothetical protein ACRC62_36335 [Microcoleus sp.]
MRTSVRYILGTSSRLHSEYCTRNQVHSTIEKSFPGHGIAVSLPTYCTRNQVHSPKAKQLMSIVNDRLSTINYQLSTSRITTSAN